MKSLATLAVLILLGVSSYAQSFSSLLEQIHSLPGSERQKVLDEYFVSHLAIPVIENDSSVYFIYRGEAKSVSVAGDATGWAPSLPMQKIEGTDYWYCKAQYEADARLEYKIVVNENNWMLDPLSKQVIQGGMGSNSELTMPQYKPPSFLERVDKIPSGTCKDTIIKSIYLDEERPVRICLPAGYSTSNARYPVIIFHDGFELFERTNARSIIDNLAGIKRIQPVIAVYVQPVHRDMEYSGNLQDKYVLFITNELIKFLDQNFRTLPGTENRATAGISNGGNISLWLAASHPEVFGKVSAQSSNVEQNVAEQISTGKCNNLKIYLDFGKYDIPVLVPRIQNLVKILEEKSCTYTYREYPEGHSWKFWQKHLPEALEYLFPPITLK
jgi:enterochelin esterase-like enzyme